MRKHEWRTCTDVGDMLLSLRALKVSPRKLRLFGCECCRRIWELIPDERSRRAAAVAEEFAEGRIGRAELEEARLQAGTAYSESARAPAPPYSAHFAARACANVARDNASDAAHAWRGAASARQMQRMDAAGEVLPALSSHPIMTAVMRDETEVMAGMLRDIFRDPFRRMQLNPAWLTADVVALARGIYDDRAFDRMPILADALQDAGCGSDDILNHFRSPEQVHVRGCWVVDLLLGKT